MKRILITAMVLTIAIVSSQGLFALQGEVVTVNGKVEIKSTSGTWIPVKAGHKISEGTMISTGFKSEATVKLGASILTVKPLTRMTLNQLVEREDTVDTELYLEVGNVKAEVNSLNNKRNGFTVKSPVATASVRGTIFEMGDKLVVLQGAVLYVSAIGQSRMGTAGQTMETMNETIASPVAVMMAKMNPIKLSGLPSAENLSPILAAISPPQMRPVIRDINQETSLVLTIQ